MPLETKVNLEFEKFSGFISEYSANVSEGGLFIRSTAPKPPGTILCFEFKLSDNFKLIQGLGEVVWARNKDDGPNRPAGMGIRFREIDESSKELIRTMIERHQRLGGQPFDVDSTAAQVSAPPTATPPATAPPASGAADPPTDGLENDFQAFFKEKGESMPSDTSRPPQNGSAVDELPELFSGLDAPANGSAPIPDYTAKAASNRMNQVFGDTLEQVETQGPRSVTEDIPLLDDDEATNYYEDGSGKKKKLIFIGGGALLLTLLIGSYFMFFRSSPQPPPKPALRTRVPIRKPLAPQKAPVESTAKVAQVPAAGQPVVASASGQAPAADTPGNAPQAGKAPAEAPGAIPEKAAPPAAVAPEKPVGAQPVEQPPQTAAAPEPTPAPKLSAASALFPSSKTEVPAPEPIAKALDPDEPVLASELPPMQKPARVLEKPLPKPNRPSKLGAVKSIHWKRSESGTVISIALEKPLGKTDFTHARLSGGKPREVVKLFGVSQPYSPATTRVDTSQVRQVRTGFHSAYPQSELHIVLDLASSSARLRKIRLEGKTFHLFIQ